MEPSGAPESVGEQKLLVDRGQMSDAPPPPPLAAPVGHNVVSREEKVEYRDQDGNILDPEQVKSLEGKVSFKTRYETRTRLVDAQGNEIIQPDDAGVAPPHPDVEGVDRETVGILEPPYLGQPVAQRNVKADESKEESVATSVASAAKPASEGNAATV